MSLSKKNLDLFLNWNGYMRFSLLMFITIYVMAHSCSTGEKTRDFSNDSLYQSRSSELSKRKEIVTSARKYLGRPYKYAGRGPASFDCSGYTRFVMNENNISLHVGSSSQYTQGKIKEIDQLEEGDLIFFGSSGKVTHVGIVTHNSKNSLKMIHASSSRGIVEEEIKNSTYWTKRILGGRDVLN